MCEDCIHTHTHIFFLSTRRGLNGVKNGGRNQGMLHALHLKNCMSFSFTLHYFFCTECDWMLNMWFIFLLIFTKSKKIKVSSQKSVEDS